MAKTIDIDAPLKKGDRVVATLDLPGVPEGTTGRVKLVNGLKWLRYWVFFDNGVEQGSIDRSSLVRQKHWEEYQRRRAAAAEAPAATTSDEAAAAAANGAGAEAPAVTAGSRIPEHLLERSRRRREQLGKV